VTLELLHSSLLAGVPGVVHAFTTRVGGASVGPFDSLNLSARVGDVKDAVDRNRAAVLAEVARPGVTLVFVKQVHGSEVVEVTRSASRTIQADGIWTKDHEAVLAVLVADCVPILLASRDGKAVAAVHAGWRGTAARVVTRAVERLGAGGHAAKDVVAALGPAIGPCCFEIGAEVEAQLRQAYPQAGEAIRRDEQGRVVADLWSLNRQALLEAGVPAASVDVLAECASCQPARFFSHRRDKDGTGRQAGLIGFVGHR
jgi:YfiH family protein